MAPREHLDALRQQARLALARDRAKGAGRCGPEAVAEAWDACLAHDAACEEAAAGLVRAYGSQGLRRLAVQAYERCRAGLEELGLQPSPALQAVRAATLSTPAKPSVAAVGPREERRVVPFSSSTWRSASGAFGDDPEDLRDLVGDSLAGVMAAVEGLGGTVTSVSGTGLQALFGAPDAHEDDRARRTCGLSGALRPGPGHGRHTGRGGDGRSHCGRGAGRGQLLLHGGRRGCQRRCRPAVCGPGRVCAGRPGHAGGH